MCGNPNDESRDPPRKYVLHALRRNDGRLPVEELIEELLDWETKVHGDDGNPSRRTELRRWLLDTYVPRLEEQGMIEYDETTGIVEVV